MSTSGGSWARWKVSMFAFAAARASFSAAGMSAAAAARTSAGISNVRGSRPSTRRVTSRSERSPPDFTSARISVTCRVISSSSRVKRSVRAAHSARSGLLWIFRISMTVPDF